MKVIAFCGPKTCGKDTAANALFNTTQEVYFTRTPFATGVKNVCAEFFEWTDTQMDDPVFKETPIALYPGGPIQPPRYPMMDIANGLRANYGADIHAARWYRLHKDLKHSVCVVTDLRFPNELDYIWKADKSLVVYIENDRAEAELAEAKAAGDYGGLNPSESHYTYLKQHADRIITNNASIEAFQAQILDLAISTFY